MGSRQSAPLLLIALSIAPATLAQAPSSPSFAVPSFADLTIKTRHSFGTEGSKRITEALYLKGARERREFVYGQPEQTGRGYATITRCDERRSVQVNVEAKLYAVSLLEDWSEPFKRGRAFPEAQGAVVTTTFDAVDTGERRPIGHYVARRVRTTITVEPSPRANTLASTRHIDGWYIDLPGLGCSDAGTTAYLNVGEVVRADGTRDRHHYKTKGAANRGYAIEETVRFSQRGATSVDSVELIELSEHPVDLSLFEIPRDYRPALPLIRGGYDMTKPDTVGNRLQLYWNEFASFSRAIFR